MTLHDAPGGINTGDNTAWAFDATSTTTSTSSTSTSSTSSSSSTSSTSTSISSTSSSISSTSTSISSTSTSSTSISISSTSSSTSSTSSSVSTSSTSLSVSTSSTSSSISTTSVSSTSSSTSTTTLPLGAKVILVCGNDIVLEASNPQDYKINFYAYAPVYVYVPDSVADVTIYFSVSSKNAETATPTTSNWSYRIKTNSRTSGTSAGYYNDFAHFTGGQQNAFVAPVGSTIGTLSINIAP